MNFAHNLIAKMKFWQQLDSASLRVRLTAGIAVVSAVGLTGLAAWTSMRMQQLLVATHKQNIEDIGDRFPHYLEIYSERDSPEAEIQKIVNNLTTDNRFLWVKTDTGQIIARSAALREGKTSQMLLSLDSVPPIPQIRDLQGSYWLLCATPIQIQQIQPSKLYIAQDITKDQIMFLSLLWNLSIATVIAIGVMIIAIAYYINCSLQPLQKISQLTAKISADKLGEVQIQLENAPSEVKQLAQTFDQMLLRLSEAWEHQRQLLSNVSHELRTPLTIISGYLQSTLRRGNNLTEIQQEALTTAASEAERTVQLLKDLLDLARAESGRMHFQCESIILNDVVTEIAATAKQYSQRQIEVKADNIPIQVKADINRLKQVLLNLIDNAVKYSEPKQPITIKISQAGAKGIIHVCDRGVGISLQQQARIFERFYRVDEARSRSGGTGLGLSIVKTLVEGMGGNISVRSQLGEGSTFTVVLPAISR